MMRVISGFVCFLISTTIAHAAPAFEKNLEPPRVFDGIRAGMPVGELSTQLAKFQPDTAYSDAAARKRLVQDAGDGARYYVLVKDDVVARIGVEAPAKGLAAKLTRIWGTPVHATNLANESVTSWTNPAWRVDLACRGDVCRMAFHKALTADYFGTQVVPPGALAAIKPWMQKNELAKILPRYVAASDVPAGPEDVRLTVDLAKDGRLRSVLVSGLPPTARALLEHAWGAPTEGTHGPTWWNPRQGWRAQYDASLMALQLFPYVPAAKLLGPGVGIAAFTQPVLGATKEQLQKSYPMIAFEKGGGTIALPPIEDGIHVTMATIAFDANTHRVRKLALELPFETPARRDELVKLLESKWGLAKSQQAGVLTFPAAKVRIEAREQTSSTLLVTLEL
ncbi:MAG TPA: hypothetical protein VFQ53_25750 [Kofleriaceae bacterium]|nr:hypothetical protein [Kofleriaceae bacterium]